MKEKLIGIGLSSGEAEVYLQLLKQKNQTANNISKETKINRSVVYSILDGLVDKGLISFVLINNIKHFSACNPNYLKDFLKDRENILKEILPNLKAISPSEKREFGTEIYQGVKGGIVVLKDIIREGKDYVSFGDDGTLQNIAETIIEQYIRQLREKKIKERILTTEGSRIIGNTKLTKVRYLPREVKFPTITAIYGDKIAIAIFDKPYYIILIKSKILAYSYKTLFEFLWKIAKK